MKEEGWNDIYGGSLTGPKTDNSSTSRAFSMGALSGSFGGGRMSVGRSFPPSSDDIFGRLESRSKD